MKVIVLDGNENQAVAAVRSLSTAGHRVSVGSDFAWSKAGWSRYSVASFTYVSPQQAAGSFVDSVLKEIEREAPVLVLPMTERTTIPLSVRRNEIFAKGGRLVLPANDIVLRAFDKLETTKIAKSVGIAVPQTVLITNRVEAEEFAKQNTFPAVLKARSSEEMSDGGVAATGPPRYARSREEFIEAFEGMRSNCSAMLAQEFVVGSGIGYFALMHDGQLRAEFAHQRIRDVRPTGSGSALRMSVKPDPLVRKNALAILQELKWHGVAMVEFRQRPDGTPVFLEVNGRFWNSLALAVYAGVDFPALVARMAEFGDIEPQLSYREGVRCRWLLGDFRHLVEVWRGAPQGFPGTFPGRWHTLTAFLSPVGGTYHDNFNLKDPLPEIGDWFDFFLHKLPARLKRKSNDTTTVNAESRYTLP